MTPSEFSSARRPQAKVFTPGQGKGGLVPTQTVGEFEGYTTPEKEKPDGVDGDGERTLLTGRMCDTFGRGVKDAMVDVGGACVRTGRSGGYALLLPRAKEPCTLVLVVSHGDGPVFCTELIFGPGEEPRTVGPVGAESAHFDIVLDLP